MKWDIDSQSYKEIAVYLVCEQQDSCVFIEQLRTLESFHILVYISVHVCLGHQPHYFTFIACPIFMCLHRGFIYLIVSGDWALSLLLPSTGPLFFLSCFSFVVGIAMLYYCGGESYKLTKKCADFCVTGFWVSRISSVENNLKLLLSFQLHAWNPLPHSMFLTTVSIFLKTFAGPLFVYRGWNTEMHWSVSSLLCSTTQ